MAKDDIPDEVKRFVFDHLDSIEQLEALLCLWKHRERELTAEELYDLLRTNLDSVRRRLDGLVAAGIVGTSGDGPKRYRFLARTSDDEAVLDGLAEAYRVRRHGVVDLMYSPLKRARPFADAFRLVRRKPGDDDG